MKTIKSAVFSTIAIIYLTACGGGSDDGTTSDSSTVLSFQSQNLSSMNTVAVTQDSVSSSSASSIRASVIRASAVADTNTSDSNATDTNTTIIVAEDSINIYPIFPVKLDIDYFALPTAIRGGTTYLVTSGDFNVTAQDGNVMNCNVLVANYDGSDNVRCIYTVGRDESTLIPVAVIRDGWTNGDLEDFDSVYFVVNNSTDGFTVYKYNGSQVYAIGSSEVGKITEILYGKYAILGYDSSGVSDMMIFRNEKNVMDFIDGNESGFTYTHKPIIFKHMVVYIDRDTGGYGIQPVVFDLNESASTTYAPTTVTTECPTSALPNTQAVHEHGIIWVSNDQSKLCEAFELDRGTPTQLAYRFLDQSAIWGSIKISNDVLVGMASFGGTERLVIEPIDFTWQVNPPADPAIQVYNFNDKMIDANLDSVTSLHYYIDGIVINGMKDGNGTVRYCNTASGNCVFETLSTPPLILEQRTDIPN